MPKKKKKPIVSWKIDFEKNYSKKGARPTYLYEHELKVVKIGALLQQARKMQDLTQEELAKQVGTTGKYISRIENDSSGIKLSTLLRIIQKGLGGHLNLTFIA